MPEPSCACRDGEVVVLGTGSLWDRWAAGELLCDVSPGCVIRLPDAAEAPALPTADAAPSRTTAPPVSHPMDPVLAPTAAAAPAAAAPAAAPAAPTSEAPAVPVVAAPAELTATTAPPPAAPTPGDIAALAQQGGGGMIGVLLAVVAVAGGGAAWKFYSQRSEQAHELAREKLKLEAQAAGLNGAQPPPCAAANVALEQKVAALTARVDAAEAKAVAAEKKSSNLSADFDSEGLERQLKRLAKTVKELQEDKS